MADYAQPKILASADWVGEHGNDSGIRLLEVDVDASAYEQGHIADAVGFNIRVLACPNLRQFMSLLV